jgi:hypothetical protein
MNKQEYKRRRGYLYICGELLITSTALSLPENEDRIILVNDQLDSFFFNVFISCLYMFRATGAHHQEDQLVLIHHLV